MYVEPKVRVLMSRYGGIITILSLKDFVLFTTLRYVVLILMICCRVWLSI